ncbi:TetR/AcrR family transcriptional regulator [Solwaraspora sp. WMMD792]|uniref:TetR/AcrR family transcriptional regulator n=1 Tax=Solwaraspora sp. WMMD792 TaxID=3016099 RepID=UPI002416FA99|nr:TetR/AcrR family transcriptional regulator [Solwaraspora sp. WMMD792]MDG4775152.1 TetR/AcrR family transcriptional regulator [Solwaraspora sp. WMMD792]
MMRQQPYHHGDLRRALLTAATEAIAESGAAALSLRDLARRVGVSHAAPTHHFGDKTGLLTAIAAEGLDLLATQLAAAGGDILAAGQAYVRFAATHRAHFEVMFQPSLLHFDAPELTAARQRAGRALRDSLDDTRVPAGDRDNARLAAWSIVHGFATLWLSGALPHDADDDPAALAGPVIRLLFEPTPDQHT